MKWYVIACVCMAEASLLAQGDASWKQTAVTGYYSDGTNWSTGVMPTNAAVAAVSATGAYTLYASAGGMTENSTTYMLANGNPLSVTFDTTGTSWKKAAANYPGDWKAFGFSPSADIGQHIFNMESMSTASAYNALFLSNAVWRFQYTSQAATNIFQSGLFDFAYKGEATRSSANWMISGYGSPAIQRTLFKPGSHTIFDMLSIRGSAPDQLTVFEGGFHEFYSRISIKCDSPNASVPDTTLVFSGSSSNLLYSSLLLSCASGNRGILRMESNTYARLNDVSMGYVAGARGLLIITNNAVAQDFGGDVSLGASTSTRGEWIMGGNGYYRSTGAGTIKLAPSASSTGVVSVAENAQMSLESSQGITIGLGTNIFAEMTVRDAAQVSVSGSAAVTIGASAATGTLKLADSALLNMPGSGDLALGTAAGAVGVLNLSGSSRLTRSGASTVRIGTTGGGTGIVSAAGNSVVTLTNNSGNVTLAGGNSAVGFLNLSSNAVWQMAGVLTVCPNAYGYAEVNLRDNARLNMGTNGTVSIASAANATGALNLNDNAAFYSGAQSKYFRVGESGARAYLNINGGVFAATNLIVEPYAYYGEINLAGGTSYAGEYRFTGTGILGSTNKLTVTGGRHLVGTSGMNMGNGMSRSDVSLVSVSGGELLSEGGGLTLGCGTAIVSNAPIQKLTVTGGRFSAGSNTVRVAWVNPSFGRVELYGGELDAATLTGGAAATNRGGTGYASFLSDGGKIAFVSTSSNRFEFLDEAKLGNGGLEITNAYPLTVNQTFADADGCSGKIVKNGGGVLSATKTSSHALTQVNAGGLTLGTGVTQFGRNIGIASGATLTAQDNVALETLAVTNGAIALSGGKTITATTVSLSNVVILTSGWTSGGSYDLITATNLTAAGVTVTGESATQVYSLSLSGGTLTLTVAATPDPATKTWQGSGSSWSTSSNWNGGTPAKQDTALFNGATPTSVVVDAASPVNTLQFDSASGYTLTGAKLTVYGAVTNVSGEHTIAAPVEAPYTTNVLLLAAQSGSKLTLSGALTENQSTALTKAGGGTVRLSGANALSGAISVEGGVLEFDSADSFGGANSSATALSIKAGSIRYAGAADASVTKGVTVADASATVTNAFIFDMRTNLTFNGAFNNTKGAPMKIGTGNLTLNFPAAGTYTVASSRGMALFNGNPLQMNGIPSTGYSGFTVVEGGVTFKGTSDMTANLPYQTVVGAMVRGTNLSANAALTVDGCKANIGGSGEHMWLGYGIGSGMPTNPALNVVNGGYVFVNALKTAGNTGSVFVNALVNISNLGWLDSNWAIQFAADNSAYGKTTVRMSNGLMRCTGSGVLSCGGPLDFVAGSGSAVTQACTGGVVFQNNASGLMRFEGGSRLNYSKIAFANSAGANLVMQFNDGFLQPNANNTTSSTVRASGLGFELLTNGVTVDMSVVARHVINLPIRGTGGLIKTGSGELVLADGRTNNVVGPELTAQYTGLTEVRAGRLTVETNGVGAATKVKVLSGADINLSGAPITLGTVEGDGTFTNGTLTATLNCTFTNGLSQAVSQPTFANVATRSFKVDFGRTDSSPVPLPSPKLAIAKVTGAVVPDVTAWSGRNMGPRVTVKFSNESGTVYASFGSSGMMLLVR